MKTLLQRQGCRRALSTMKGLSLQTLLAILLASITYANVPGGERSLHKITDADSDMNRHAGRTPVSTVQAITVTGTVADANGQTVPGVNVIEKGTTNGTTTDLEGKYTINLESENSVLVFSFIGYVSQEVAVNGRTIVDMTMAEEVTELDEVVVIGYGTAKKSDLTGSVASVNVESFKTQPMVQFTDMLAGTVAGFNANQGTSAAGGASIEIRGPKSLSAGTDPLIVLDGVIFTGSLRDINPNDIQSIDILKDASSAAVFGSKAAAGVILITTKKGKPGKPTINFSSKLGITESNNQRRGLNPQEYIQFRKDYFRQMFPVLIITFIHIRMKFPVT
jgi:TonB-dependent SusC/RagA subfamily outer membrane receptor